MKAHQPYMKRMREFLHTRLNINESALDGKSVDELKAMLPKPPNIRTPQDGFEVFDLLHSEPDAPRVPFRNFFLFPDGARCDIPSGQFFRTEGPPDSAYRRASAIFNYWKERLRPVQTEFDQLKNRILNDKEGFHHTDENLARLEELFQTASGWSEKLAEAAEAKEKADPNYRTPEQLQAAAEVDQQISARRAKFDERVKEMSL